MPRSLKDLTLSYETSCNSELETLLAKISWNQNIDERIVQKENKLELINSLDDSLMNGTPNRAKSDNILIHEHDVIPIEKE